MCVRYLELSLSGDAVELYNEMLDKKIAYEQKIGSHTVSYIDIAKSVAVIENDILHNNALKQIQKTTNYQELLMYFTNTK